MKITQQQCPQPSFAKGCLKITCLKPYPNAPWVNLLTFSPQLEGLLRWAVTPVHQSILKCLSAHTYVFSCSSPRSKLSHYIDISSVILSQITGCWLFFNSLLKIISKVISKVHITEPLWGESISHGGFQLQGMYIQITWLLCHLWTRHWLSMNQFLEPIWTFCKSNQFNVRFHFKIPQY